MFKRIIYTGLMGLLLAGCPKKETYTQNLKYDLAPIEVPKTKSNLDNEMKKIEEDLKELGEKLDKRDYKDGYKKVKRDYKDGYKKMIRKSQYENLEGTYMNAFDRDCITPKIEILIVNNPTLDSISDCNDDGKVDEILLGDYIDGQRDKRSENPKEFELADEILKYWKSQ